MFSLCIVLYCLCVCVSFVAVLDPILHYRGFLLGFFCFSKRYECLPKYKKAQRKRIKSKAKNQSNPIAIR